MLHLAQNLENVRERIDRAVERSGRDRDSVTLIAVTKQIAAPVVDEVLRLGVEHIGESRVQEAFQKFRQLENGGTRHLIGTLQRNKVGRAMQLCDVIHSVDRVRLVSEISRRAGEQTVDVFLQVNVSGEETKHGVKPNDLEALATAASEHGNLNVLGLMTMAPYDEKPEAARPYFEQLRLLGERLQGFGLPRVTGQFLSMGMSNDFEIAIEEGATHVRIGSALFNT